MTALALIVLLAFAVETMAGFGATVITVTLASHLMPIGEVLAALVPVNMLLSAYLVLRYRDAVEWGIVLRRGIVTMGLGVAIGMGLYRLQHHAWMKAVFAGLVVTLSVTELVRMRSAAEGSRGALRRGPRDVALVTAGVIHGVFACGGPLLVYVLGRELDDKGRFRATLSAIWLVLNGALIANLIYAGDLGAASLRTSAVLLGSLGLGVLVGERLHTTLPEARFRVAVYALLFFAGTSLLVRTLLA